MKLTQYIKLHFKNYFNILFSKDLCLNPLSLILMPSLIFTNLHVGIDILHFIYVEILPTTINVTAFILHLRSEAQKSEVPVG